MRLEKLIRNIEKIPVLPLIFIVTFINSIATIILSSFNYKLAIYQNLLGLFLVTALLSIVLSRKFSSETTYNKNQIFSIYLIFLFSITGAIISLNYRNPGAGLIWLISSLIIVSSVLLSEKKSKVYFISALTLPVFALVPLIFSIANIAGFSQILLALFSVFSIITLILILDRKAFSMSNSLGDSEVKSSIFSLKSSLLDTILSILIISLIILSAILSATSDSSYRVAYILALVLVCLFSIVFGNKNSAVLPIATPILSSVVALSVFITVFAAPSSPVISQSEDSTIAAAMLELPLPEAPKESQMTGRTEKLLPGSGGVRDEFKNFSFDECDKLGSANRDCFITYFVELAERTSISKSVDDLVEKLSSRQGKTFQPNCHEVTHSLGRMASLEKNLPLGKALALDPMVCSSGFTHGIWEELISQMKPGELEAQAGTFCLANGQTSEFGEWACTHILGHNLVLRHFKNPEEGAIYCTKLESNQGRLDCLAGAWMEYWVADTVMRYYKALGSVSKPFEVCARADADIAAGCYLEIFPTIATIVGFDYRKVFSACESYAPGEYLRWCALGAGRGASVMSFYERDRLEALCKTITSKYMRDMCFLAGITQITMATGVVEDSLKSCNLIENEGRREACRKWVYGNRQTLDSGPNPVVEIDTTKPADSGSAIDRVPSEISESVG